MNSILIANNEQINFNESFGMANLEDQIPNTPNIKFRMGL